MVDKIMALRPDRIRERIGTIDGPRLRELDRTLAVVLGLAD
jgi:mRNA-degrading endonuclease toxin of MazEF toxin-antitoxin module